MAPNRTSSSRATTRGALLAVLALVAGTAIEVGRQAETPAWRTIWAEDGEIFLADAENDGFLPTLFDPYAGYMLLVPRVASAAVALFPLEEAAWLIALLASAIVAAVALFVYFASAWAFRRQAPRIMLAAAVVLVPTAAAESTANLSNVHWFLLFACFWALLDVRHTPGAVLARTAFAVAAPLTNPLAALFGPLVLVRRGRSGLGLVPWTGYFAGVAVQATVVLVTEGEDVPVAPFRIQDLPSIFAVRVAGSFLIGDRSLDVALRAYGHAFEVGAVLVVGALLVACVRALEPSRRWLALVSVGYAVVFFLVPLVLRGSLFVWPVGHGRLSASRYFLLPVLFLFVAFLLAVDVLLSARASRGRTAALVGIGVWLALSAIANYSLPNGRSAGPDWRSSLRAAKQRCVDEDRAAVGVRIAPLGTRRWAFPLKCPT